MNSDSFTTLGMYLENNQEPEATQGVRWKAIAAIITFVTLAFTLGFSASSSLSRAEAERLKLDIHKLQQEQEKLRREFAVSNKKETFRTMSCRIKKGKEALAKSPSNKELQVRVKADEQAMATFIVSNVDQDKDPNGIPAMRIVKGETAVESVVKFEGDDLGYRVPDEVKKLTPPGTFYRSDVDPIERISIITPQCRGWENQLPNSRTMQHGRLKIEVARIH